MSALAARRDDQSRAGAGYERPHAGKHVFFRISNAAAEDEGKAEEGGDGAHVLAVTSSTPAEGKSTTAVNLAATLAETGARVLLVDADLRRPTVADVLGLEGGAGLTTVLAGQAVLADVVQEWGEHRLGVLTSGPVPPNPAELLGSPAMRRLVAALRGTYDFVDVLNLTPALHLVAQVLFPAAIMVAVLRGRMWGIDLAVSRATLAGVMTLGLVALYLAVSVIVAVPPTLARRLHYDPVLPAWRDQLTQKTPAGTVIKTFAAYPTPFWREHGLNGQAISEQGPVKVTFDVSPPDASVGILLGFVEGGEARRWQRLPEDERRRQVVACFTRYFGSAAGTPTTYLEKDWSAEEFTRGCYGAHFAPGVWTGYGEILRDAVGRIHWAGAEYAVEWNGYMEGAVRSGRATAEEVLAATRRG